VFGQKLDDRLLQAADEFAHLEAAPGKVEQRIDDDLAGAVVGNLSAAVDLDQRNAVIDKPVFRPACLPEGVNRRMLAEPQFIQRRRVAGGGEIDHRPPGRRVVDAAQGSDEEGRGRHE
jgi:hypothetical protein